MVFPLLMYVDLRGCYKSRAPPEKESKKEIKKRREEGRGRKGKKTTERSRACAVKSQTPLHPGVDVFMGRTVATVRDHGTTAEPQSPDPPQLVYLELRLKRSPKTTISTLMDGVLVNRWV